MKMKRRTVMYSFVVFFVIIFTLKVMTIRINYTETPMNLFKHNMQKRTSGQYITRLLLTDVQEWFTDNAPVNKFRKCSVKCEAVYGDVSKQSNINYDMVLGFPFQVEREGRGYCSSPPNAALQFKKSPTPERYLRLFSQIFLEPVNDFAKCKDDHDGNFEKESIDVSINYHRNSTLLINYSSAFRIPVHKRSDLIKDMHKRYHGVCVFVSNCKYYGAEKRLKLLEELAEHIPMRSYGSCFHNADTKLNKTETIKDCMLYLSFENNQMEDYVTEKFYDGFIPAPAPLMVYRGAPNIDDFSPTRSDQHPSFVDANQFETMKDLASFLNDLLKDKERYDKYFDWRKTGDPKVDFSAKFLDHMNSDWNNFPCRLCAITAEMQEARKVLSTFGIQPLQNQIKIGQVLFEKMLKKVDSKHHEELYILYDKAYGRYWRRGNEKTDWNRLDYEDM
ncbi:FUT12 [Acrasis kona]|uniref:Fucosyltransferase n=1 Tax=Acrasis kona TaxID=1008807 RepID=A0AAW2ZLU5_9EUKA